jgi:hypothetical protein
MGGAAAVVGLVYFYKFCENDIAALSFLFDKYYLIIN